MLYMSNRKVEENTISESYVPLKYPHQRLVEIFAGQSWHQRLSQEEAVGRFQKSEREGVDCSLNNTDIVFAWMEHRDNSLSKLDT